MERIKETIIVEGKDDRSAILSAVEADVICTSGYGLNETIIENIKAAYERNGIIIFTDPDYAGRKIRESLSALFPNAKHAYLTRSEALKSDDVGVENANAVNIFNALKNASAEYVSVIDTEMVSAEDLFRCRLSGFPESANNRELVGKAFGIGYANAKNFLKRLGYAGISRTEFLQKCREILNTGTMKKVLIIANHKTQNCEEYANACSLAGLESVVSDVNVSAEDYDALIVPGGADVNPKFYGEENKGSKDIDTEFDELEFKVIDDFYKSGKPIMGICRGLQILNIYFGGSLVQDIEGHLKTDGSMHGAVVLPGTDVSNCFKEKLEVNSTHHQCIDRLGKDLELFVKADDGTPEGFIHTKSPVLAVQWHPEKSMENTEDKDSGPYVYKLFAELVYGRR